MTYTLKWSRAISITGKDDLPLMRNPKREYPNLDKARAAGRRQVYVYGRFYEVAIQKEGKTVGWVVYDNQYAYGGSSGIFWVPKGSDRESAYVHGVNTDGTLNKTIYRLT